MPISSESNKLPVMKLLKESNAKKILELGVGYGQFAPKIKIEIPGSVLVGVEIFKPYFEKIPKNCYARLYNEDIRTFDYDSICKEIKFDVVMMIDVLEHLERNEGLILLEKLHYLFPLIIISVPIIDYEQGIFMGNEHEVHKTQWKKEELAHLGYKTKFIDDTIGVFYKRRKVKNMVWKEEWNTWNEDWSEHSPSPDQHRIDEYILTCDRKGKKLLYVGIGDSTLPKRFQDFQLIDGITVLQSEIDKAVSLNIKNYNVYLCNKHTYNFLELKNKYHYIVDNGIFTFTDCFICAHNILFFFIQLLEDDGMILTDTQGLIFSKGFTIEKLESYIKEHQIPLEIIHLGIVGHHVVGLKKK